MKFILASILAVTAFGSSLRPQQQPVLEKKNNLIHIPLTKTVLSSQEEGARLEFVKMKQKYMFGDIDLDYDDFESEYKYDNDRTSFEFGTPEPEGHEFAAKTTNYQQQAMDAGKQAREGKKKIKTVDLYNFKNTQYTGKLGLGKETEEFDVIYDTGSANLWINSARCKAKGCKNHKQYDSSDSTTYKNLGLDIDVEFGTGALTGEINSDNAYFGGVEIKDQAICEIVDEDGDVFAQSKFDGIVGLAFPSMAAYDENPLFDNIIEQHQLDSNVFSFFLEQHDGKTDSKITLGGADPDLYQGKINYHKVSDEYYWLMKADNILIGGKDVGLCTDGCNVIADTGTSLLTGPSDSLYDLLEELNVDDNCHNISSLPSISFVIDSMQYTLEPSEYVMTVSDDGVMEDYADMTNEERNNNQCAAAFMPLDIPAPQDNSWILGDVFLNKFYSVYDRDQGSVGFALAKH